MNGEFARPHKDFLARAIDLARVYSREGTCGPFGAVVVRNGEVIGEGWNRVTSTCDPSAHAEIVAIRAACAHLQSPFLDGCVLYSSCEPCPMCLAAAYWAHVPELYFAASREDAAQAGFDDAGLYKELALPTVAKRIQTRQCLEAEGAEVLAAWRDNPNRIPY